MERTNNNKVMSSSSNLIKHQSCINGGRNIMKEMNQLHNDNINSCNKVKDLWDSSGECCNNVSEADLLGLFSWPPRSYTCSFCKREFRSAQALGGHMNVHRRDRARLRQSPPRDHQGSYSLLNLNLDPNPTTVPFHSNPSFSSSTKPSKFSLPSLIPPSVSTISTTPPATVTQELRKWGKADFVEFCSHSRPMSTAQDLMKRKATKRFLELEKMGSIVDDENESSSLKKAEIVRLELEIGLLSAVKEEVDLELRLGYI